MFQAVTPEPPRTPAIGILGGGQLARMLALAAWPLGTTISVLQKNQNSGPWRTVVGDANDTETAVKFAQTVDVVTLENEFVAQSALEATGAKLFPTAASVKLVQDKYIQKKTLAAAGIPVAPFSLQPGTAFPLILKRRFMSYDGKGNFAIRSAADLDLARRTLGDNTYAEDFVEFDKELAVMITRGRDGTCVAYPVVETIQKDHICHVVKAPAEIPEPVRAEAARVAMSAVGIFGGVGTWGVELFLARNGKILVNEMAPRVHNSGHYTIEACECSQFENHIRAILGWPLGSSALRAPAAVMINLLGAGDGPGAPSGLDRAMAVPGAHVHVYGKDRSAPGRKMGHVTALGGTHAEALATAQQAANFIRFP